MAKGSTILDELNELIDLCQQDTGLRHWAELVEGIDVPTDLAIALSTGRAELLRLATPRDMTAEEVGRLYKMIEVLIRTNMLLQRHSAHVARQVTIWAQAFRQLHAVGRRIEHFANFRRTDEDE